METVGVMLFVEDFCSGVFFVCWFVCGIFVWQFGFCFLNMAVGFPVRLCSFFVRFSRVQDRG